MWANRNSGDFLSKSGEVKLARAIKGDISESRRRSGGAARMGRFGVEESYSKEHQKKKY